VAGSALCVPRQKKWSDIEAFHETLEHRLYMDPKTGIARSKARIPEIPRPDDVDRWLTLTAACGDAKALRRPWIIDDEGQYNVLDDLHERRVLQLNTYFEKINGILSELPVILLGGSSKLRSFAFGGVARDKKLRITGRPALEKYYFVGWPQPTCFDPATRRKFLLDLAALKAIGAKDSVLPVPVKKEASEPFRRTVSGAVFGKGLSPRRGYHGCETMRLKSAGSLPNLRL